MDAIASTDLSICKSKSFIPNNQTKSRKSEARVKFY